MTDHQRFLHASRLSTKEIWWDEIVVDNCAASRATWQTAREHRVGGGLGVDMHITCHFCRIDVVAAKVVQIS